MAKRDFRTLFDISRDEVLKVIDSAIALKEGKLKFSMPPLQGKTLAMIFLKSSTRTRISFEVGMYQLGGYALFLSSRDIQLGRGETIADTARVLSRFCDAIMARVFGHSDIEELAEYASVPVINGLSDKHHPCQALADFQTIKEKKGKLKGVKLAYVGDGNNVCHSLIEAAAMVGAEISVAAPKGYEPAKDVVKNAEKEAKKTGARISIMNDAFAAVKDADAVYTDVWASMGQEDEAEERKKIFAPYQVNAELLKAAKPDAIVLHCLPAHRGEEITDEVIDGPQSVVFDQAENRLHAQKALLLLLFGKI
jgi:ornithine carbamoyltransferase